MNTLFGLRLPIWPKISPFFFLIFFNLYLFLRERERVQVGEEQREGDIESEAGAGLRAVSTEPDAGLKLTNREITT